ncbi:hypothetical protein CALVIDRAFT_557419 [Calocera viscosa TUFC12733]|uniref:Zn(2)-C6 fungal-type domain-containing protein n=1 Tax=Calocera viscosa (strain TUFC12733) TaxID=1330018 RepID=A0A167IHW9_CALVF|nr:hypothetical protein CALVIDRAFT_557419 [Calocera viscosa TUFC12733]
MPPASSRPLKKHRPTPYEDPRKTQASTSTLVVHEYSSTLPLDEQPGQGASSSDSDKQDHRKNKRNRSTLSCWHCHKNKRKCDRGHPCTRCRTLNTKCVYEHDTTTPCNGVEDENLRLRGRVSELETILRLYRGKPEVDISHRETYDWVLTMPELVWHLMQGVVDFAREASDIFGTIEPEGEAGECKQRLQTWLTNLNGTVTKAMNEAKKSRRDMPPGAQLNGYHMPTPVPSPPSIVTAFASPEDQAPPPYTTPSPETAYSQSPMAAVHTPVYEPYDGTVAPYDVNSTAEYALYDQSNMFHALVAMPDVQDSTFLMGFNWDDLNTTFAASA